MFQINKQFLVPGNGIQAGSRRDTVGSVSDDDKMVICEDRPPETNIDPSSSKAGKCDLSRRDKKSQGPCILFSHLSQTNSLVSDCQNSDFGFI